MQQLICSAPFYRILFSTEKVLSRRIILQQLTISPEVMQHWASSFDHPTPSRTSSTPESKSIYAKVMVANPRQHPAYEGSRVPRRRRHSRSSRLYGLLSEVCPPHSRSRQCLYGTSGCFLLLLTHQLIEVARSRNVLSMYWISYRVRSWLCSCVTVWWRAPGLSGTT